MKRLFGCLGFTFASSFGEVNSMEKHHAKKYVDIWKRTGAELDRVKSVELRAMSEEERLRQATAVMEIGTRWLADHDANMRVCGLVEQQRFFSRWPKKSH